MHRIKRPARFFDHHIGAQRKGHALVSPFAVRMHSHFISIAKITGHDGVRRASALGLTRNKIGEIGNLIGTDGLERLGHGCIIADAYTGFIFAQGLDQVILALGRNPRHALLSGKIRAMASIAVIESQKRSPALESDRVAALHRLRRREFPDEVRDVPEIIVAQSFRCVIHDLGGALLFAKQIELYQRIGRILSSERWHFRQFRFSVFPVTSKTGGKPRNEIVRRDGNRCRCDQGENCNGGTH
jgi:hypothetical protein